MLPGSSPCDLRLLIPDAGVGQDGFHFNDKHSGSETIDYDKVSKSFPAWTVTRDFWEQALKPEISGIAVDIKLFD